MAANGDRGAGRAAARPNVLLILTDQHRLSAVGAYGPTPCRTPHIDSLAAGGVRFETAYTACPVCSPARATIMTGLYPHGHGMVCNTNNIGCSVHDLPDRPELLSRRLGAAGYRCGYSGKWHMGGLDAGHPVPFYSVVEPHTLPRDVGFEGQNFPGHGGGGQQYPEYQAYLRELGLTHRVKPWDGPAPLFKGNGRYPGYEEEIPVEGTVSYFLAGNTIDLMKRFQAEEQPFFIWHSFWGPHGPYLAPREFVDLYRGAEIPPWPNYDWPSRKIPGPHHSKIHPDHESLGWDYWASAIRAYYAFTGLIDAQIGRMLDHLDRSGLAENTVVIFSADHGETLGSHGGLTDKGYHHFEETHRIPLIVRLPGGRGAGRLVREFASLADLYPTILELAGAAPMDGWKVHGRSLVPLLEGRPAAPRDAAFTEFHGLGSYGLSQRTIRCGGLKYGYNCGGTDELYDLEADPHETVNLVADPRYAAAARRLRQRLLEWMRETDDDEAGNFRRSRDYLQGSWDS
jgi:arylsulfatase A-like enzyme